MSRVNVNFSLNATGVVIYDTIGRNVIKNSVFTNNNASDGAVGGGGFYVEFSFCTPGDDQCNDTQEKTHNVNASYLFQWCVFSDNAASNAGTEKNSTYIVPYRSSHQAFGRGGGLSIFVKGTARSNTFEVRDCIFKGNLAVWGGGFFVEFHDETANNLISVTNCTFVHNKCSYLLAAGSGGGGMRLGHYVYNFEPKEGGNNIDVTSCNFTSNFAMYGGGLPHSRTLALVGNPSSGSLD